MVGKAGSPSSLGSSHGVEYTHNQHILGKEDALASSAEARSEVLVPSEEGDIVSETLAQYNRSGVSSSSGGHGGSMRTTGTTGNTTVDSWGAASIGSLPMKFRSAYFEKDENTSNVGSSASGTNASTLVAGNTSSSHRRTSSSRRNRRKRGSANYIGRPNDHGGTGVSVDSPEVFNEVDNLSLADEGKGCIGTWRPMFVPVLACILLIVAAGLMLIFLEPWEKDDNKGSNENPPSLEFFFNQCPENSTSCCNGLETNCQLKVNEIMIATARYAVSSPPTNETLLPPTNRLPLEDALEMGYRGLMLEICNCGEEEGVRLCYASSCSTDTYDVDVTLQAIKNFLDSHETEVVLLMLQMGNNTFEQTYQIMESIPGFIDLMYAHPGIETKWPLMGDLVTSDKDNGPDCNVEGNCPSGFHNTFSYVFETSRELRGIEQVLDYEESCSITSGYTNMTGSFFIMNHFANPNILKDPSPTVASRINFKTVLEERVNVCTAVSGRLVNWVVVDFFSLGDLPEVTQLHNRDLAVEFTPSPTTQFTPSPTAVPTFIQSTPPSRFPSMQQNITHSAIPSLNSSIQPSHIPSLRPLNVPTSPSMEPTGEQPSSNSSSISALPSSGPTLAESESLSLHPSAAPSNETSPSSPPT
eukprot:scaffold421287_cov61-Attheya_sp.AAC.3